VRRFEEKRFIREQRTNRFLRNFAEHEALKVPLKQLETDAKPVAAKYASLEARTNTLLRNYNDYASL